MLSYAPPAVGESAVLDTFERTSSDDVLALVQKLRKDYDAGRSKSRVQEWLDQLNALNTSLNNLSLVPDNWNGYGSPAPSKRSIQTAQVILYSLGVGAVLPDRVLPSADGGVALLFLSDNNNRAAIETLNDEGPYVLLYDRQGNSKTLPWSDRLEVNLAIVRELSAHIQGEPLATA